MIKARVTRAQYRYLSGQTDTPPATKPKTQRLRLPTLFQQQQQHASNLNDQLRTRLGRKLTTQDIKGDIDARIHNRPGQGGEEKFPYPTVTKVEGLHKKDTDADLDRLVSSVRST